MEPFPLEIIFTAAGALVGAGVVTAIVELAKKFGVIAETGRAPMLAAAVLSLGLVLLAAWSLAPGISPESILLGVLSWLNVTTAAIGTHAAVRKTAAVMSGSTNPSGPDPGA